MRSEPGHFDVIPANRELAGAEIDLVNLEQRDLRLKVALAQVADDYDFILMDCPPTLNLLTVNAFASAQSVLVHADAVREFLKTNGVMPAQVSNDAEAAVVRVICVRK